MSRFPVVIDLETKYTFKQFSDPRDLKISVMGIYDYKTKMLKAYFEKDITQTYQVLENASIIIGYNINHFDLPVLSAYYPADINQFSTFDIMNEIKTKIGKRLALNDILQATLGKKKTGHGLAAIELYRQKKFNALAQYCLDDVNLTRELFEYGINKGVINYLSPRGKQAIKVNWKKYQNWLTKNDVSLTLPF